MFTVICQDTFFFLSPWTHMTTNIYTLKGRCEIRGWGGKWHTVCFRITLPWKVEAQTQNAFVSQTRATFDIHMARFKYGCQFRIEIHWKAFNMATPPNDWVLLIKLDGFTFKKKRNKRAKTHSCPTQEQQQKTPTIYNGLCISSGIIVEKKHTCHIIMRTC